MMTVAQANEKATAQILAKQPMSSMGQTKAEAKSYGNNMRSVNFKMGSILPENNNYKLSGLDKNSSAQLGLSKNTSNFKPQFQRPQVSSNQVSSGNNIAKGSGSFKTVNQEFTNWI